MTAAERPDAPGAGADGPTVDVAALVLEVGGELRGPERTATTLCDPSAPVPDGIAVAPDARAAAAAVRTAGAAALALLVVPERYDPAASDPPAPTGDALPPILRHPDPRRVLAAASRRLDREPRPEPGVHRSAVVAPDASVGAGACIGPHATVGAGAVIGERCVLDAGAVVGAGCRLGPDTRLYPHVVLYPGVIVGAEVRIHAGTVLGGDGFGYAAGPRGPEKIHHLGGLRIGDRVEVGRNATIDRGTVGDSEVGSDTKIDAHCLLAHNVRVGRGCLIVGGTAIGGSVTIGDGVILGGAVAVRDHVRIGDGARLAARSAVSKDVPPGATWMGEPARPRKEWIRERHRLRALAREADG